MLRKQFTVLVEGNIASGKSTLLEFFSKRLNQNALIVTEPIDKWMNCGNVNLLVIFLIVLIIQ